MKTRIHLLAYGLAIAASFLVSCKKDTSSLESRVEDLEARVAALEETVSSINDNATALGKFLKESIRIVGYEKLDYGYTLSLSDGTEVTVTYGTDSPSTIPILGVNSDGEWIVSVDGGETFTVIEGADNALANDGVTPQVKVSEDSYWLISYDGGETWNEILDADGKPISTDALTVAGLASFFSDVTYDESTGYMTFTLLDGTAVKVQVIESFYMNLTGYSDGSVIYSNETLTYPVELGQVEDAVIKVPENWSAALTDSEFSVTAPSGGTAGEYEIDVILVSTENYLKKVALIFKYTATVKEYCDDWNYFDNDTDDNVLLDFSYAGYNHGETAPPDVYTLGYTVYDVTDYGAVPNDGKSDREAFLAAYQAAIGANNVQKASAKAIIYFPEGEFILHTSDDDTTTDGVTNSNSMILRAGDFVIKGAGRDKTTLLMQDPNLPTDESVLYSSPTMIQLKHNSGLSDLTTVTANAEKGSFSVEVASTAGIAEGDWVCLYLLDNDEENSYALLFNELAPYKPQKYMTDLINNGIRVTDYHQVKSISGNTITFYEPIMHEVDVNYDWSIKKYPHYENVGVEDLTFKGNSKADFEHHASWQDDGAYKPIDFARITNGWLRRVRFTSVSECCSIINSANVSAYDIEITGNRGHAAVRSQQSSRVFIGKVTDTAGDGEGQYHATGVSKPSMGAVIWRSDWGTNSCFEAHATQPRATLLDCCTGGWMYWRQGGDYNQMPNHMADLTIWNFNSKTAVSETWIWWNSSTYWWRFLPPTIVGFHGEACTFDQDQVKRDANHGEIVAPESLYEAQLRKRLGAVPAWLEELK